MLCTDLCPPVSTDLPTDLCSPVITNSSTDSCSHLNSNLFDVLTDHNYVLSQHSLRWYVLNVCGFKQKIKCPDFQKEIQYKDFVILTETKLDDIDVDNISKKLSVLGYFIFTKNRSHCSTHRSGGILVAIRNTLQNYLNKLNQIALLVYGFLSINVFSDMKKIHSVEQYIYRQRVPSILT